jgi:hypothetical protein
MYDPVNATLPTVRMPEGVWKRLVAYIDRCPMEVGGLGTVDRVGDSLVVGDVFLLEQDCSPASTVLDPAAVAKFVTDWATRGEDPARLRFWWHSHATFDTDWSGIDYATMALMSRENWLLAFVGNHKREWRLRLTTQTPFPMALDRLPLTVVPDLDPALLKSVDEEMGAKVRRSWTAPWPFPRVGRMLHRARIGDTIPAALGGRGEDDGFAGGGDDGK